MGLDENPKGFGAYESRTEIDKLYAIAEAGSNGVQTDLELRKMTQRETEQDILAIRVI